MKKIIVLCAAAGVGKGSNTGMNTVDFAIENLVNEAGLQEHVEFQRPWSSYHPGANIETEKFDYDESLIKFNDFKIDEDKTGLLLYWGDFQHGEDYNVQTKKRIVANGKNYNLDVDSTTEGLADYLLLNNYFKDDKLPFKVASYGVTLFQNNLSSYLNTGYLSNLKWLYKKCLFSKSRESYTANTIGYLRDDYDSNYLGVDCALLTTKEELLSLKRSDSTSIDSIDGGIGVYFGRSTKKMSRYKTVKFINEMSDTLDKPVVRIPWNYFGTGLLGDSLGVYSKLIKNRLDVSFDNMCFGDIFNLMSKMNLIITDTYHVAINSIALSIPVICIYETTPARDRDANMGHRKSWRDKRCLLFMNNQLSDFLINSDDLKNKKSRKEKVNNITTLLGNKDLTSFIYSNIHAIAQQDRKMIIKHLKDVTEDLNK